MRCVFSLSSFLCFLHRLHSSSHLHLFDGMRCATWVLLIISVAALGILGVFVVPHSWQQLPVLPITSPKAATFASSASVPAAIHLSSPVPSSNRVAASHPRRTEKQSPSSSSSSSSSAWIADCGAGCCDARPFLRSIQITSEDVAMEDALTAARSQNPSPTSILQFLADSNVPIPPWKPCHATPIICDGKEYYSGHFSIPSENIVAAVPAKVKEWAHVIPGRKETYIFKQEAKYREDMMISHFGISRRRYGFATNRNLEMLAASTIPYFCGIESVPRIGTLASLPMTFLRWFVSHDGIRVRCWPPRRAAPFPINASTFNKTFYLRLAEKLLDYTKAYQPTTYHALYVLSATSLPALPKHVLLLWASHYTVMLTGLVHGLRSLGVTVEDIPRRAEVYLGGDCQKNTQYTYARGWFFFCKANESLGLSRSNIEDRIRQREFDLVIISVTDTLTYHMKNVSADIPYWDAIVASYSRDRIVTMNDADLIRPMQADVAHKAMHAQTLYFKRETHGCRERIW